MIDKTENPPAFPLWEKPPIDAFGDRMDGWGGMTLRDYFAGQALAGLLANQLTFNEVKCADPRIVAKTCYGQADAMLKARAKS